MIDTDHKTLSVSGARDTDLIHAKQMALKQQEAAYEAQKKRHKRLTVVANKLRDSSAAGASFVSTDRDKLQRDFKRDRAGRSGSKAKAIETLWDSTPQVGRVVRHAPLRIDITPLGAGTDSSLILNEAVLGHGGVALPWLPPITLRVDFGERVAIVGFNGVGKSTLLGTLTRVLEPVSSKARVVRELRLGNLMQEHESLPRKETTRAYFSALTGMPPFEAGSHIISYGLTRQTASGPTDGATQPRRPRPRLAGRLLDAEGQRPCVG
mmetsp:Transcript_22507/g.55803  ORF Transcript_22507/g.55803 Transcript_22507/m.55803 type:complete len:266 (+) Transcript_22507:334-1131(+)